MIAEHHVSMTASVVLKTHTNMNGLAEPSQLTRLKLMMRINTPIISMVFMFRKTNEFMPGFSLKPSGYASKTTLSPQPAALQGDRGTQNGG